jgi:hypothetical protein
VEFIVGEYGSHLKKRLRSQLTRWAAAIDEGSDD